MDRAPVWIQPLANVCFVRVEGKERAKWLLTRLSRYFVFKTSEPVTEELNSSRCTFRLAYSSVLPRQEIERILARIPEIQILLD
jgi:hypothetical protein